MVSDKYENCPCLLKVMPAILMDGKQEMEPAKGEEFRRTAYYCYSGKVSLSLLRGTLSQLSSFFHSFVCRAVCYRTCPPGKRTTPQDKADFERQHGSRELKIEYETQNPKPYCGGKRLYIRTAVIKSAHSLRRYNQMEKNIPPAPR